jgi:serine/threonine protein kinase
MEELDLGQTIRGFRVGQKVFRRYTLVRILGRGGMGVVWLARDEELERDVALKFLPDLVVHDLAVLDELKRETRRSLQLTHHHIVRIHDFVQDAESACISMEYVDGPTLSALRVEQPERVFEPAALLPWVEEICGALEYAHRHARIVHRDIKPANLMLNSKGELKVADFGIARSLSDSVSMLTMARGTSGTLAYMSPQQLDGERASNLDDIYSLGATLYELLTSKPPFYSGGIERLIREKTPPSIAARREDLAINSTETIPEQWEQTIAACLAKDPGSRPQSALEVSNRLHRAPHSAPTLAPSPTLPVTPLPPKPPTSPLPVAAKLEAPSSAPERSPYLTNRVLLIGAAVILAVTVAAVWWASSTAEETVPSRRAEASPVPVQSPAQSATVARAQPSPVLQSPTAVETIAAAPRLEPSPSLTPPRITERAEIETMVTTQIDAGTRGDVAASMSLYADNVDFFEEGLKTRDAIAHDMPQYFARWPVRRSTMVGDVSIETLADNERKVSYTLDFEASNPATREVRQSKVEVTWIIRRDGAFAPFKIVSHKQKSVKQEKPADPALDPAIEAVKSYFAAVNNQDGTTAYRLFAAAYRNRVSFQKYLGRLKNTGTLTLNSIRRTAATSDSATVEVTFREVEPNGKVIQWQGPILLVLEAGEWRIETLSKLNSQR